MFGICGTILGCERGWRVWRVWSSRVRGTGSFTESERNVDSVKVWLVAKVTFGSFYTHLPPVPPDQIFKRTFCLLPAESHPLWPFWKPVTYDTKKTEDEVACHLGMFNPRTNMSFYEMGLDVVNAIAEAVGIVEEEEDQDVEMD